jgi:hypothetical protein
MPGKTRCSSWLLADFAASPTTGAGAPHGMCSTLKDKVNQELLAFFQRSSEAAA